MTQGQDDLIINIEDVLFDEENANTHPERNLDMIRQSLAENQAGRSILVDEENRLIAGEGVTRAARQLGYKRVRIVQSNGDELIAVKRTDLTSAQKRRLALFDNQTTRTSEWDLEQLEAYYSEDPAVLDGILSPEELEEILDLIEAEDGDGAGSYDAPEVETTAEKLQSKWQVRAGDLWEIPSYNLPDSTHRLLCGDCTVPADVEQLITTKIDMLLTDPPYGVDYADKNRFLNKYDKGSRIQTPIENDGSSAITNYRAFFAAFLQLIPFANYNTAYIFMAGQNLHNLRLAFDDAGLHWGAYLIWLKNNHVLGRKDYHAKYEFVAYAWSGRHKFYGDFSTTVLEFPLPRSSKYHPTEKPIVLLCRLLRDGSQRGMVVYDAFGGSGTTLLACEQTQRVCYTMEKMPAYCAVILERAELAGLTPRQV